MSQVVLLLLLLHHLDSRLLRMPAAPAVQDRLTRLCSGLPVDDCRSSLGRSESNNRCAIALRRPPRFLTALLLVA